jgi:dihydrofolate reductase
MSDTISHSIIVAMCENRVIGRDGGMPWHLPGDLKYFKSITMAKPIIMGRRTFQSIGRPLPGRSNIVITRDNSYAPEGVTVVHTLDDALAEAETQARNAGLDEIMIIGGGQIYAESLARADKIYLTEIHATIDGDTVFPELPPAEWREVSRVSDPDSKQGDPRCSFVILERTKGGLK